MRVSAVIVSRTITAWLFDDRKLPGV